MSKGKNNLTLKNKKKLKVLSLFSGIGAFEKALTNIGLNYSLVGFSEINKYAITSYCAIHGVDKSLNLGDISKISNKDLPKSDLVTYGFPCQDISVAGQQKGIKEGTRSGLLFQAERIIKTTRPKYAIAENVKNLIGKSHIKDFKELLKRLDSYGYNNYYSVLNAKDFNVPQNRERVFIVSIRKDIDKTFDFNDVPKIESKNNILKNILLTDTGLIEKHLLSDKIQERIQIYDKPTGKNVKIIGTTAPSSRTIGQRDSMFSHYSLIGSLVATDYKQPKQIMYGDKVRKISAIESYRLMGFTDEDYYKARKALMEEHYNGKDRTDSQMYKQAGNSIVVPVLEGLLKVLFNDNLGVI